MKAYLLPLSVIFVALASGLPCWGQADVSGIVRDRAGVPKGGAVVEATDPTTEHSECTAITKADGTYTLPQLAAGKHTLTAWTPGYQAQSNQVNVTNTTAISGQNFYLNPGYGAGEFYRIILGVQQTGASSTASQRKLFADLFFDVPGPKFGQGEVDNIYGPHLRFWGDVRASSIPVASPVQLSQFNLSSQASKLDISQIAQSISFMWGTELRIFGHPPAAPQDKPDQDKSYIGHNDNPNDVLNLGKFTGSLFLGFGATTPLNPQESATLVDGTKGDAASLYQSLTGTALKCPSAVPPATTPPACTLALVSKDTSQFLSQWYVGLRLKTHYFTSAGIPVVRPPALLDLAVGQNEAVTQDRFHGMVFKVEGFYPLPFEQLHMIYLFGRADLQLSAKPVISNPFVLAPAASTASIADTGVITLALPLPKRDAYQVGIGVDLIPMIGKLIKPSGQ